MQWALGELCWVTGTVYMDMPLKPNVLDDISKDVYAPGYPVPPCPHTQVHFPDLSPLLALDCSAS